MADIPGFMCQRNVLNSEVASKTGTGDGEILVTNDTPYRLLFWMDSDWREIGSGSGSVTSIDVSGGTTGLTFSGGPVTSSGTITMAGTLAVANGGTGATTASGARTNLGLAIGSDVQAYDAGLASIAGLTTAADRMIYTTASDTYAVATLTSFARTLLDDADAATARATLGLTIGTHVQAYDADLAALAALSGTNTIYYRSAADTWTAVTIGTGLSFSSGTLAATGSGFSITGLTAVTTLESTDQFPLADASDSNNNKKITLANLQATTGWRTLGSALTTNSVWIGSGGVAVESAAANGTVLRRSGAGNLGFGAIELNNSAMVGSSILTVANGGTGENMLSDHYVLVGSGTSPITPVSPSTAGRVLTSNGTGADPSFQDLPTATTSSDEANATTDLDSSVGTWMDTGAEFTPSASKTFLLSASLYYRLQLSSGTGAIQVRIQNVTDATTLTNSEALVELSTDTDLAQRTVGLNFPPSALTSGKTYRLQAKATNVSSASFTNADVFSNTDGRTILSWVKLTN